MKLTGSQIVIETLLEQGVTDVFGYPGGQVVDIYDALYHASDRLNHVLTAHEQGAAHAADGYARATGKVGVVIATSGPGATNLVTGIATAMLDSVPMVAITGNVPCSMIGKDGFQEINITGVTMPITKHNYFVTDINELADTIREAFQIAKSGRPGPVLVDIPKDVQRAMCEFTPQGVVAPFPQEKADDDAIDRAVALIDKAKRPYIYIGGGAACADMTQQLMAFADKIDGCIGCSLMALSVLPHSYERFLGMQGMHGQYASTIANKDADLIIGIGVRFSDRATGNTDRYARQASIIQLDADLSEINKNVQVDVGVVGDITDALTRIAERCKQQSHPDWQAHITDLKAEGARIAESLAQQSTAPLTPRQIIEAINDGKPEDAVVVTDVGQHQMWTAQHIRLNQPRRFATSGGLGTMGYGLGAAIGAQIASGCRTILVTGDGSFGMNLTELATAVTYNLPITIVLLNNGVLGMVRQWQTLFFGKRYASTRLNRRTDFPLLAQAFGARSMHAETPEEFAQAFAEAMAHDGPCLIEAMIDQDELVLPMMPPGGSIDDLITEKQQEADT